MTLRVSRKNNISRTLQSLLVFKLFELVVVMLVLSGLYYTLIPRVMSARGAYETAEVNWTVAALGASRRTERAIIEMNFALGKYRRTKKPLPVKNPMSLMSPQPRNYIGEFCNPDTREIARGSWYFDHCNLWLVYVFNSEKIFASEYPKVMKFNVESLRLLSGPATLP
ncbi:MAG TPA: hypothetical protein VFT37_15835 [Telluria sp.]|nr:hypothetical protein [Telluria sp.]